MNIQSGTYIFMVSLERKDSRKMGHMTVLTNDVNQTEQDMYAKFEGVIKA